jgi:hypothetical protein
MAEELTPKQEKFAAWLATPQSERRPATYDLMAKELGVVHTTLYRWRQNPRVKDRAQQIVDEAVGGPERVRMVLDRIYDQALEGSSRQQELFLKYAGLLVDRKHVETVTYEEADGLTDEEIEREWQEAQYEWDSEAREIFDENDIGD